MIIAGTGHRPDKLGGYSKAVFSSLVDEAHMYLTTSVVPATKVISGGALGWDQALAKAAIDLGIPTVMALPFENFEIKWPQESQQFLRSLMEAAEVRYICEPGYAPWKMQERNKWMVDNCDTLLALWNGTDGGTANCVRYAIKIDRPIVNLWESFARNNNVP